MIKFTLVHYNPERIISLWEHVHVNEGEHLLDVLPLVDTMSQADKDKVKDFICSPPNSYYVKGAWNNHIYFVHPPDMPDNMRLALGSAFRKLKARYG